MGPGEGAQPQPPRSLPRGRSAAEHPDPARTVLGRAGTDRLLGSGRPPRPAGSAGGHLGEKEDKGARRVLYRKPGGRFSDGRETRQGNSAGPRAGGRARSGARGWRQSQDVYKESVSPRGDSQRRPEQLYIQNTEYCFTCGRSWPDRGEAGGPGRVERAACRGRGGRVSPSFNLQAGAAEEFRLRPPAAALLFGLQPAGGSGGLGPAGPTGGGSETTAPRSLPWETADARSVRLAPCLRPAGPPATPPALPVCAGPPGSGCSTRFQLSRADSTPVLPAPGLAVQSSLEGGSQPQRDRGGGGEGSAARGGRRARPAVTGSGSTAACRASVRRWWAAR